MKAKTDILSANFITLMQYVTGAKESIDIIGFNGESINASEDPEEESKRQLFRTAEIARRRIEAAAATANGENKTFKFQLENVVVKEE